MINDFRKSVAFFFLGFLASARLSLWEKQQNIDGVILTGENVSARMNPPLPMLNFSSIKPTWTDLGSNTGVRSERPVINHLSHGTAF